MLAEILALGEQVVPRAQVGRVECGMGVERSENQTPQLQPVEPAALAESLAQVVQPA